MHRLLVGSDIELMPQSIQTGQESVDWWRHWLMHASGVPPKGERLVLGDGYWMHRDGFSIEYGIPPCDDPTYFIECVNTGKLLVEQRMGMEMMPVDWFSVATVRNELRDAGSYLQMGCSPDFQVQGANGESIERAIPEGARNENIRECGGHIHISLPQDYINDMALLGIFVRHLDDLVYPMFNLSLGDYRSWYRHRMLFRPTPYGVEYRSLGAESLFAGDLTKQYIERVFEVTESVWRNAA